MQVRGMLRAYRPVFRQRGRYYPSDLCATNRMGEDSARPPRIEGWRQRAMQAQSGDPYQLYPRAYRYLPAIGTITTMIVTFGGASIRSSCGVDKETTSAIADLIPTDPMPG